MLIKANILNFELTKKIIQVFFFFKPDQWWNKGAYYLAAAVCSETDKPFADGYCSKYAKNFFESWKKYGLFPSDMSVEMFEHYKNPHGPRCECEDKEFNYYLHSLKTIVDDLKKYR